MALTNEEINLKLIQDLSKENQQLKDKNIELQLQLEFNEESYKNSLEASKLLIGELKEKKDIYDELIEELQKAKEEYHKAIQEIHKLKKSYKNKYIDLITK